MAASTRNPVVWLVGLCAGVALGGLPLTSDPFPRASFAQPFALRAVTVAGAREPIAQFDGRQWVPSADASGVDVTSRAAGAAIAGLESTDGGLVSTVGVVPMSSTVWPRARAAVEALASDAARLGPARVTEVVMYAPPGLGSDAVFVDLVTREPDPAWRGAVASAWVRPGADGSAPVVLGARVQRFASYAAFRAIPRRHPLGVAVAGPRGAITWVMHTARGAQDTFELVDLQRRGLFERPPIVRGGPAS
jgi:hypothetical protein